MCSKLIVQQWTVSAKSFADVTDEWWYPHKLIMHLILNSIWYESSCNCRITTANNLSKSPFPTLDWAHILFIYCISNDTTISSTLVLVVYQLSWSPYIWPTSWTNVFWFLQLWNCIHFKLPWTNCRSTSMRWNPIWVKVKKLNTKWEKAP